MQRLTLDQLIKSLKSYYGKWPSDKIENIIRAYIERDIDEKKYNDIKRYILYYHPLRFKAPGIASIESAIKQSRMDGRGTDCRKTKTPDTRQFIPKITAGEMLKNQAMLKQYGGLRGLIKSKRRKKK